MKKRKTSKALPPGALALKYLREAEGISRPDHAARLGHSGASLLGKYELGNKLLSRDALVAMVEPIGQPEEAVDALVSCTPKFPPCSRLNFPPS